MAQKISGFIKLNVPVGNVQPNSAVGAALALRQINVMAFCSAFNSQTKHLKLGSSTPVLITRYADQSFTFNIKG